jgi:N-acyl-D-aspartate/D-glutamate deacylase
MHYRAHMLERLEKEQNHGKMLVSHALGYLAASRHGLSEDALVDLLSRDFEVYSWFFKGSQHVPPDLLQLAVAHRPQPVGRSASQDDRAAMDWLTDTRTPPESVEKFSDMSSPSPTVRTYPSCSGHAFPLTWLPISPSTTIKEVPY